MLFSEAIFRRQKRKQETTIAAYLVARIVADVSRRMLGFAESAVLFLLYRFQFEYLRGFFVKILLQPSQQK